MSAKRAMHDPGQALVEAFLAGQRRDELLWDSVDPTGGVSRAVGALRAAMSGPGSVTEALAQFKAVRLDAIRSAGAQVIFLDLWLDATFRARLHIQSASKPLEEMEVILKRMKRLVRPDSPPGMRVLLVMAEGSLANARGDRARHLALYEKATTIAPPGSLWHRRSVLNLANLLANLGRLADAGPLLEGIAAKLAPQEESVTAIHRFVDAVEGCRLDEAIRLIEASCDSEAFVRNKHLLLPYQILCCFLANLRGDARSAPPSPVNPSEVPWARVMEHLLARRPEAALSGAHEHAAAHPTLPILQIGTDSWNLLRAELSCRNVDAARRILARRHEVGNVHHLDDFFLARIELLAGNREAAARHFAKVSAACERFRSLARLDLELRMSCELSAADGFWLGRAAAGIAPPVLAGAPAAPSGLASTVEPRGTDRLIGRSRAILEVKAAVQRLAPLEAPVLITGETGTGKELVARALHELGTNAAGPFIAVNCGAIAESLLESELFGHEKGAFTGAERAHQGIFEAAAGGSVLLDEVGEMPARLQVALLRVLETGEVRPVGSARSRRIACRILAATNAPLESLAAGQGFRPDLLYRLQRLEVRLPPLRERTEDILALAEHFLSEGRRDGLRPSMSREVQEWLLAQPWPGNVRELRNAMERMRLLSSEKLHYAGEDLAAVRPRGANEQAAEPPSSTFTPTPASPEKAQAPESHDQAEVENFLRNRRTPLRRLDRIRELFARHGKLTRAELSHILGASPLTIGRDLKRLMAEGLIEKVRPTAAARTHYFALRRAMPAAPVQDAPPTAPS